MEIFLKIVTRLVYLLIIQLVWDVLLHKSNKNLDQRIEDTRTENSRLYKECHLKHKDGKYCNDYCTLVNRCQYMKKEDDK